MVPSPGSRDRVAGVAERVKLGCVAGCTTSLTVVVCFRLPLVPSIFKLKVPFGVFDAVLILSVAQLTLGGTTFEFVP